VEEEESVVIQPIIPKQEISLLLQEPVILFQEKLMRTSEEQCALLKCGATMDTDGWCKKKTRTAG
jgi:hypothetical protein